MANLTAIPDHYATQFAANWSMAVQQIQGRLKDRAKVVATDGQALRLNVFGTTSMTQVTTKNSATPNVDIALPSRWAYLTPWETSSLFGEFDEQFLGQIVLPTSDCIAAQAAAYNRLADSTLISALTGSATVTSTASPTVYSANNTTTTVALPGAVSFTGSIAGTTLTSSSPTGTIAVGQYLTGANIQGCYITAGSGTSWTVSVSQTAASGTITSTGQAVGVQFGTGASPSNSNMSIAKLREAKRMLDSNEVPNEGRVLVISSGELAALLGTTETTSSLFNSVQALVAGDLNKFLGFDVVRSELLTISGGIRTCIAYQKDMVALATGSQKSYLDVRPDISHALQVRSTASLGATRLQEFGVVTIACDSTK
jgi:hypothetical protein